MIAGNDTYLMLVDRVKRKEIYGPNFGHLGPNLAQNEVFGHLLEFGSFDFPDFAYYDSLQ